MKAQTKNKIFADLGRIGGKSTARKYGSEYMRKIGLKGLSKRYNKSFKFNKKK